MPDLKQYWQEVRAIEKSLPEFVWLMSLDRPSRGQKGGSIAEVAAGLAARLIQERSHRRATDEEIAAHRAEEESAKQQAFEERMRKLGVSVVPLGEK